MPPSLAEIYDDHAQALFAFLLNVTRCEAETRDVLQELFLKLARHPEQLSEVRQFRGYLMRLAHRIAIDGHRRKTSHAAAVERAGGEAAGAVFDSSPDADQAAFRAALSDALAELPPEQRAVVHLKLWEEMTFAEIAEALGIGANTAASRYRYGLEKLQHLLRPIYQELQ